MASSILSSAWRICKEVEVLKTSEAVCITHKSFNSSKRVGTKSVKKTGFRVWVKRAPVSFAKIKKAGVDFVIMRVGYRGYGSKGSVCPDNKFEDYYKEAREQGLEIGVYFYSQAISTAEAKEEADYTLKRIKGLSMDLPVYFDYEFAGVSDGRLDYRWRNGTLTKKKMTANAKAFCSRVTEKGYVAGIYASTDFLHNVLNYDQLDDAYSIWDAHYTNYSSDLKMYRATTYKGNYQMWQYSAKGRIKGAMDSTYVDCNFLYVEPMQAMMSSKLKVSDIKERTYTGEIIKPAVSVKYDDIKLIKGEDYYLTYKNCTNIGTAKVIVTFVNDYSCYPAITKTFKIVPTKVKDLIMIDRTETSVTVKWDKHDDATKYRVQVLDGEEYKTVANTKNTEYTITDLEPSSNITVRVAAVKVKNSVNYVGRYSTPLVTTANPGKVVDLRKTSKNTDSIRLKWKEQSGASYFKVYEYNFSTKKYEYLAKTKHNYYTAKNLKINSKHRYRVRAYKIDENEKLLKGEYSKSLTTYTSPAVPTITLAKSYSKEHITVKWKKVNSASGYKITYSTSKTFAKNNKTVTVSDKATVKTIIKNLKSKKNYYVRIRSYKLQGKTKIYSKYSKTLSATVK